MSRKSILDTILNWIYPENCVCCGTRGKLICDDCLSGLRPVGKHYCSKCGKPLRHGQQCRICATADFSFQSCRAPYLYEGPAAAMIKNLKYSSRLGLAPILASLLSQFWQELGWEADLVIPVPLSQQRKASRGFNQSELIGRDFARNEKLVFAPNALQKVRHTPTQVGLNQSERRENLKGSFAAEPSLIEGKRILLLDDVMTTGSTFAECSETLLEAGAGSVKCLSVATTPVTNGTIHMKARKRPQNL